MVKLMNNPDPILLEIKDNVPKVYEAGYEREWNDFWDIFQNKGGTRNYMHAFARNHFDSTNYKPKYKIKTIDPYSMFQQMNFTDTLVDIEVLSQGNGWSHCFYYCSNLKTIRKIIITGSNVNFESSATFQGCSALENITFEGEIRGNLYLRWSSQLTHDSLMSIINHLKDYALNNDNATHQLNLGSTNLAKLTDEEKAIATNRGWTLS